MNSKELQEQALALRAKGYNCCQAVAVPFCDAVKASKADVFRMAEGFGLGMGDMQLTCGALSGLVMVAGLYNSDAQLENPGSKGATRKIVKQLQKEFADKTGGMICKDLKGLETGEMLCDCPECIRIAVDLAVKLLEKPEQ